MNLKDEFQFYIDHQDDLVKKHGGKFIVIKEKQVIGVFDNEMEAVREVSKQHILGTFLVQKCEPGNEGYTQTFHSRVAFV